MSRSLESRSRRNPNLEPNVDGRRPRLSRWGIRVRRRRVKLQVSPLLGYLRGAYRMDPRLPGSKLGPLLAKLQFSCKRARRIHSIQASYESYEQAQPLLDSNPSTL
ncbi:hypothetical protein KC19_10G096400 [Ceratodon purpureus]|uniref:Uncharacterized protein n=1 Tax=Ceratodon purpureus TaxID=3225 RepID=A0A8T0GJY3_CERPU|nr:hypothetical protein KC19_10G096400 [Ceratodon purpureus]